MWAHSIADDEYWTSRLPWFLPILMLAALLGLLMGGRLGRWLGVPRLVAWGLVMSVGLIVASTLSPVHRESGPVAQPFLSCDVSRVGPAALSELTRVSDPLINILLFAPLGFVIALVPKASQRAGLIVGAVCLPFLIEAAQSAVTGLGRGCETADVVDNLTGLALGLALGASVMLVFRRLVVRGTEERAGAP